MCARQGPLLRVSGRVTRKTAFLTPLPRVNDPIYLVSSGYTSGSGGFSLPLAGNTRQRLFSTEKLTRNRGAWRLSAQRIETPSRPLATWEGQQGETTRRQIVSITYVLLPALPFPIDIYI